MVVVAAAVMSGTDHQSTGFTNGANNIWRDALNDQGDPLEKTINEQLPSLVPSQKRATACGSNSEFIVCYAACMCVYLAVRFVVDPLALMNTSPFPTEGPLLNQALRQQGEREDERTTKGKAVSECSGI